MSSEAYNQPVWVALFQPIRLNRIVISSNKETISLKIKKIPIGEKQSNINQGLLYPPKPMMHMLKDILLSYITTTRILRYISSLTLTVA